jgi:hypothetical protein
MRNVIVDPKRLPFGAVWWGMTAVSLAAIGAGLLLDSFWLATPFLILTLPVAYAAYSLWRVGRRW